METIIFIREIKARGKPAGSNLGLSKAIAKTIDEYNLKHSDVNDEMIRK